MSYFELGEFNDNGIFDWLHYDWLEKYTKSADDVKKLNDVFSKYRWQFKVGGYKHWSGDQCTGATLKHLITKEVEE